MNLTVGGRALGSDRRVDLRSDDPLIVEGLGVVGVRTVDGVEFELLEGGGFGPPGDLEDELVDGEESLFIDVRTRADTTRIEIRGVGVHLTPEKRQALLDALGGLAMSLGRPRRWRRRAVGGTDGGDPGGDEVNEEQSNRELWRALEQAVPGLLRRPIVVREVLMGPVPVERVAPTPAQVIARILQPHRRLLRARHAGVAPARRDYRWLLGVLTALRNYADERIRLDMDLRDDSTRGAHFWVEPLQQLDSWTRQPIFDGIAAIPVRPPSWAFSRSVPGAMIMRTLAESAIRPGVGGGTHLHLIPLAPDSHLYELWIILGVVDVLRMRFGFELRGKAQTMQEIGEIHGDRWFFRDLTLDWNGIAVDGNPLVVTVQIRHEPALATHGEARTPDLVMDVSSGRRSTRHILDAKLRGAPLHLARRYARDRYLLGLRDRPTSSFVALPVESASTSRVMGQIDGELRHNLLLNRKEDSQVADATGAATYGFAWGSLRAAPPGLGEGESPLLGLRQFVTMALQYHRTELRHVCGNCGEVLQLQNLLLESRAGTSASTDDLLAAHSDTRVADKVAGTVPRRGRLMYRCPGNLPSGESCGHTWSRDVCLHGHVLMKYGRLTPHLRTKVEGRDEDWNVYCAACGHVKGGKPWP